VIIESEAIAKVQVYVNELTSVFLSHPIVNSNNLTYIFCFNFDSNI